MSYSLVKSRTSPAKMLGMPAKNQAGFTIVELLIAGTLGLILLAGVIQLFTGSQRTYTLQNELAGLQEDGRFALMILERQLQKSSWNPDVVADPPIAIDITNSEDGANDSVVLSFKGEIDGVDNLDCNNIAIADGVVVNKFYVVNDELMCQGNGGGDPQVFVDNVDKFQLLYGVETDLECPDGVVNSYMTKTELNGSILASRILSVRFALLLKSGRNLLSTAAADTYQMLDESYTPTADKLVRRLFQQTVFMPNAVYMTAGSPKSVIDCMSANI